MKQLILATVLVAATANAFVDFDIKASKVQECAEQQAELYEDICGESGVGYESLTAEEAHFEGVLCAVQSMKVCLGVDDGYYENTPVKEDANARSR